MVIILYLNASIDCEDGTVLQNQADIPGNGDAAADGHIAAGHIPMLLIVIRSPVGGIGGDFPIVAALLCSGSPILAVFITIEVGDIALRRRHGQIVPGLPVQHRFIRRGNILCTAYLTDIAAGRTLDALGIAAVGVVFCVVFA